MDFIVDELRQISLVPVLELKLVDEESFQLLSLLNFDEALSSSVTHLG